MDTNKHGWHGRDAKGLTPSWTGDPLLLHVRVVGTKSAANGGGPFELNREVSVRCAWREGGEQCDKESEGGKPSNLSTSTYCREHANIKRVESINAWKEKEGARAANASLYDVAVENADAEGQFAMALEGVGAGAAMVKRFDSTTKTIVLVPVASHCKVFVTVLDRAHAFAKYAMQTFGAVKRQTDAKGVSFEVLRDSPESFAHQKAYASAYVAELELITGAKLALTLVGG